jgi:predicted nuclease of predicted toxin-antitoxin system
MKILIDECTPRALKLYLAQHGHVCSTVQEAGWAGKVNGELLSLAQTMFDVLVTIDTNLQYQQNLSGRKIAIVILLARSNRLDDLQPHFADCVEAISRLKPGDVVQVGNAA